MQNNLIQTAADLFQIIGILAFSMFVVFAFVRFLETASFFTRRKS